MATRAQLIKSITDLYSQAGLGVPSREALGHWTRRGTPGLSTLRSNLGKDRRTTFYRTSTDPTASPDATSGDSGDETPVDPMQAFLDQIKPLLQRPDQPTITPFDQSGFYNEGDTKTLAEQEYEPFYTRRRALDAASRSEEDRRRGIQETQGDRNLGETVNAAGGFRSSAYQRDLGDIGAMRSSQAAQRKIALDRSFEDEENQKRAEKSGFVTNRRNEAFQRYLQSIGAVTG